MTTDRENITAPRAARFAFDLKAWALHALCLFALMWTPIVNGYAFFFDDTTNYIRAADMAAHLASGREISTPWTDRYSDKLPSNLADEAIYEQQGRAAETEQQFRTHNDISAGLVMTNRSPYMGALMWLGYVTSDFWLFIVFQAALAYFLIALTLQRFGIESTHVRAGIVIVLAALTPISFYNGMLLADAFGAFGILAFLLLATPGQLTKTQSVILYSTIAIAVMGHLTHIVMLAAMIGALFFLRLLTLAPKIPARGWIAGIGGVILGLASVQVTAFAVERVMAKEPQLLPLLTARFIADGPGREFIEAGCDGNRFQVCRVELGDLSHASAIISDPTPGVGTYLNAEPEERRRMGEEDKAFAFAVLQHDPAGQIFAILRNTFRQFTWIEYTGVNRACSESAYCWNAIPPEVGEEMKQTLADREEWPEETMDALLKLAVVFSLCVLAICLLYRQANADDQIYRLRYWTLVALAAVILMSVFGGAVVEPQWRYLGRLSWLPVLFAIIAAIRRLRPVLAGEGTEQKVLSERIAA